MKLKVSILKQIYDEYSQHQNMINLIVCICVLSLYSYVPFPSSTPFLLSFGHPLQGASIISTETSD